MSNIETLGENLAALDAHIIKMHAAQHEEIETLEAARSQAITEIQENAEADVKRIGAMFDTLIANRRKMIEGITESRFTPEAMMKQAAE